MKNSQVKCPAKKLIVHNVASIQEIKANKNFYSEPSRTQHNHPIPDKAPLSPEKKVQVEEMLQQGVRPAIIHKRMVMDAPEGEGSSKNVPKMNALWNRNAYRNKQSRPTPDEVGNVIGSFGGPTKFLRHLVMYPNLIAIFATDTGLDLLREHGKYCFTDGTFNLFRDKDLKHELVLWTIMIRLGGKNGPGFPCAFILTDAKDATTYEEMFHLFHELMGQSWTPTAWLVDFETALDTALRNEFPDAKIYGDEFHFHKCNIDWMRKHGGQDDIPTLVNLLRFLTNSPKEMLDDDITTFRTFWTGRRSEYAQYFETNWLKRFPVRKWALCHRDSDTPSGDQILEAFHIRLKDVVFQNNLQRKFDTAVALIWEEALYSDKIATSPGLLQERQKQVSTTSKQSQRAKTLKAYLTGKDLPALLRQAT